MEVHSWPGKVPSVSALGRWILPECLSPPPPCLWPSEMLSYSCHLSWRVKIKGHQGLSPQSSALHLLSPSCPGKSTAQPGGSHPSFPVSLLASVPEHPPCPEQERPICSAGCLGGLSRAPALWGPLPPPAGQQVPRKVTERPRPGPTAPRPHWRTRAAILSIFGQIQRRVPRPPASLRLFEVSLGALICLPPAASPGRQFLVESRLTAPLLPGSGARRGRAGCGAGSARGPSPNIPLGPHPLPGGKRGSAHAGTAASCGCRGGLSSVPPVLQFFLGGLP